MLHRPQDRWLWMGWLITNSIGWFLCLIVLFASAMATTDAGDTLPLLPYNLVDFVVTYSVLWGIIGSIQAGLLRGYTHQSRWWVLWWIGACALGWAVFWLLLYMGRSELASLGAALLGALGIGILQWSVLRRALAHAGWWIVVNVATIGALAGVMWIFTQLILHLFGGASPLFTLTLLLPGVLFGAVTGYALVVLLQSTDAAGIVV